jgi:hypothetical protein
MGYLSGSFTASQSNSWIIQGGRCGNACAGAGCVDAGTGEILQDFEEISYQSGDGGIALGRPNTRAAVVLIRDG